jgi:protein disulfide-isomerase A1
MKKQALPALTELTGETHAKFTKDDKVVVVAYVDSADDAFAKSIKSVADNHRDDYLFGITSDAAAIKEAGVTPPALVLYKVSELCFVTVSITNSVSDV